MHAEQENDYCLRVNEEIIKLFEEAFSDLFADHEINVEKKDFSELECTETSMCIIGAGSAHLKLSICLNAEKSVLQGTYPANLGEPNDEKLTDWIGELSNQLMGRLKNKLINYECRVSMNIPTIVYGQNMGMVLPKKSVVTSYSFSSKVGQINTMLSIITKPEIENEFDFNAPSADGGPSEEGELMFF